MNKRKVEDYLKTIYMLHQTKGIARGADIADKFGVKRSTLSVGLDELCRDGFIEKLPDHSVILTSKGLEIAQVKSERCRKLYEMIIELKICEETAEKDSVPTLMMAMPSRYSAHSAMPIRAKDSPTAVL